MIEVMKKKTKRKISIQKIFCLTSFIFILTCCLWYGGRFVYFYKENKKINIQEANTIVKILKTENHDKETFKQYNKEYYFYQDTKNNYITYSNILWRIVKINEDNSILLVTDKPITNLAYGTNNTNYKDSNILNWLNKNNKNLEQKLNKPEKYLSKNIVCTDEITNVEKLTCEKENQDYYLGLLTVENYIKTGAKKSFINKNNTTYLANQNKDKEIWYITEEGNLDSTTGNDILGIKPTITLSPNLEIKSGDGSENNPYKFEEETTLFASYVQLDKDIWRIYDFDENNVKLVLMDYVKDQKNEKLEYIYSNSTYKHNDTIYGSLAYYLNHTYLNSLSYKNIILNEIYTNGYYGENDGYDLKTIENEIDTKIALPSIGDTILNYEATNYFTSTGTEKDSTFVYINKNNNEVGTKRVTNKANIVPCITIKKDTLSKGTGTKEDPYRTEKE